MLNVGITFAPLLSLPLMVGIAVVVVCIALFLLLAKTPGRWWRIAATALVLLALLNPVLTQEDRDPLKTVIAVVLDRSASQSLADRSKVTDEAKALIERNLGKMNGMELRFIEAGASNGETDGTNLFEALRNGLSDVPRERVGAAILVTDGQVHDIPEKAAAIGFQAPVHALITGRSNDRDRRMVLVRTPRFGLVGGQQQVGFRVDDRGTSGPVRVEVTISRDGEVLERRMVTTGQMVVTSVPITHAGTNIVEIEAAELEGELTLANNRGVVLIEGIREKLRVLLVSGEPHAGERTWRNLLKSDPGVDLVHFTILRPPEKQDGTPINELSLIAFPTRELFQVKIKEFDLIIFDRYAQQGILPTAYFENIARYVKGGGAVLVAAGPEHTTSNSVHETPLAAVLPAEPTGGVIETGFHAKLSDAGKRHPVTRNLPGAAQEPPQWSRFFRLVEARTFNNGTSIMSGPGDKPLLALTRQGEGRVALILSDHIWLWARGYEGGGPHLDLLRRLAHWLMKEPELEEEALRLTVRGRTLAIERQTMADVTPPVVLTSPSGVSREISLTAGDPGLWRGVAEANELGLWKATSGDLTRLIHLGPANPREWTDVTSTTRLLEPLVKETGGGLWRIAETGSVIVPRAVPMRLSSLYRGEDWMGIRQRDASTVKGIAILPVFAGLLGLCLFLMALTAMWLREGR